MVKPGMFISDRYEIMEKVGTGGMADVYKARCHRLNRFVAIKILKAEFSDDKNFVMKFRGEAQSAAGLSHPNIVNVYDVGEDDGLYYIVMELVEGITLKNFIERKGKLEVKEALGIAIQIAQGMEAAHDNNIIHRDIKPQNIIISREGKVKVTDFGIAKAATSNTITSNAMGSVHYISPEQARGGYSDERSDIYSLGITLYEMLAGKVPYEGDSTISVAMLHIQGEATPLRILNPDIPISVDHIVQKCMQKKPERRYLSVSDLIVDLKRAIAFPNEDFVKMSSFAVDDSPTIEISDKVVTEIKTKIATPSATKNEKKDFIQSEQKDNFDDSEGDNEEDDNEGDVDPKLEKLMVGGGIAAAVILAIIIIVLIGRFTGLFSFGGKTKSNEDNSPTQTAASAKPIKSETPKEELQTVPNVIGKEDAEAKSVLENKGFKVELQEVAADVSKGQVTDQSPAADTKLKKNGIVKIYVSSGSDAFALADLYNYSETDAKKYLSKNGLILGYAEKIESDSVEAGRVVKTSPAKGSDVKEGDTIRLYLSKGKTEPQPTEQKVTVPTLLGKTEQQAISELKAVGLTGKAKGWEYSDNYPEGQVKSQDITIGMQVDKGTEVLFTISKGPKVVSTPVPTAPPVDPTPNPDDTPTMHYEISYLIENNPFPEGSEEEGKVALKLIQGKKIETIYEATVSSSDFPLEGTLTVSSGESGYIVMEFNGQRTDLQYPVEPKEVME